MNDYSIKSRDEKTIQFSGELIGSSESAVEFSDGLERKFCLKTYSTDAGFVAQIDFMTEGEGEQAGTIIEKVDSVNDVQNFSLCSTLRKFCQARKG